MTAFGWMLISLAGVWVVVGWRLLADLADGLSIENRGLEAENRALREKVRRLEERHGRIQS